MCFVVKAIMITKNISKKNQSKESLQVYNQTNNQRKLHPTPTLPSKGGSFNFSHTKKPLLKRDLGKM